MGVSGAGEHQLLLAEQRHRFGNFVQLILGLVRLRIRAAQGEEAKTQLAAVTDLISTLYTLHDGLGNVGAGAFAQHLEEAGSAWAQVSAAQGITVTTEIEDGVELPERSAELLALIAHELVTNSLEHAFPDGREGGITLSFGRCKGGQIELCVHDDGVGPSQSASTAPGSSMGLSLAKSLSASLGGTFELTSGPLGGAIARVRLPASPSYEGDSSSARRTISASTSRRASFPK